MVWNFRLVLVFIRYMDSGCSWNFCNYEHTRVNDWTFDWPISSREYLSIWLRRSITIIVSSTVTEMLTMYRRVMHCSCRSRTVPRQYTDVLLQHRDQQLWRVLLRRLWRKRQQIRDRWRMSAGVFLGKTPKQETVDDSSRLFRYILILTLPSSQLARPDLSEGRMNETQFAAM